MNKPLVSVIVLTYNSDDTIVETLNSIKNQTYGHIELVISDDCSKDNTCEIVQRWIDENFPQAILVRSQINTGTSGNINRGVANSTGTWLKVIAGDDLLRQDAIEVFMNFVEENRCEFCVSDIQPFCPDGSQPSSSVMDSYAYYFQTLYLSPKEKMLQLAKSYSFAGPGFFYSRSLFDLVDGCDERYPLIDEIPLVYKVLRAGYDLLPVEAKLVLYRYREDSVSHSSDTRFNLPNRRWFKDFRKAFFDIQLPILVKNRKWGDIARRVRYYSATSFKFLWKNLLYR